ncbi:ABC transporter permease [Peribacillus psychrosaccharolyticus]|uniref:ABC transporter permease n=1 Tax=Peribacillus psychrosaccharolyticus TaxID=1407 RepID=A0A974NR04_PERPY|nr:ABC transporter permease [Peribacillus psychrosaccharolyticus]MEC2057059.1 ABC transporter permease [Peribacillus psychrosaccharolyticus]MED3744981.1 ABC transporter permease [Peribacillus psychrosaccharolyticus]QQT02402.1 ABC transporter permease [Peribacillus psychrosaccharolyticus]
MLKLIKLEIKKFKLAGYLKTVLFINLGIMIALCGIYFAEKSEGISTLGTYKESFEMIGILVRAAFIVFASVLISKLIIDEYRNNTISILFTYPINRKKIMLAKILLIAGFTFVNILLSSVFIGFMFFLADLGLNFVPEQLTSGTLTESIIQMPLIAFAAAGMGLVPLYFGMIKKSVPVTIVTSILLISLTNTTVDDFTLSKVLAIPIVLGFIGVLVAYFSVRNIDHVDID